MYIQIPNAQISEEWHYDNYGNLTLYVNKTTTINKTDNLAFMTTNSLILVVAIIIILTLYNVFVAMSREKKEE